MEEDALEDQKLLFTGERFIPEMNDSQLRIEHIQRYKSVRKLVEGKIVLDAACGEGYGSEILSKSAAWVFGIDISSDAVEHAAWKYFGNENLTFMKGNIEELPFENKSLDVVVSFETIEHVPGKTQGIFLQEIKRVLKEDGFLVMSTPNKEIYSDLYHFTNKFHIKEFYEKEFKDFLLHEFKNVKLYNQYFEVVCLIDTTELKDSFINFYKNNDGYMLKSKYYIAVAGNKELPVQSISSIHMNEKPEYQEKIARIIQLQNEEEERNQHLFKLDKEIEEKNNFILQLQDEVEKLKSDNRHLTELLSSKRRWYLWK